MPFDAKRPGSVAWISVKRQEIAAGTIMEPCHGSDSGSKQPFDKSLWKTMQCMAKPHGNYEKVW